MLVDRHREPAQERAAIRLWPSETYQAEVGPRQVIQKACLRCQKPRKQLEPVAYFRQVWGLTVAVLRYQIILLCD
jgi:hypothetical protein